MRHSSHHFYWAIGIMAFCTAFINTACTEEVFAENDSDISEKIVLSTKQIFNDQYITRQGTQKKNNVKVSSKCFQAQDGTPVLVEIYESDEEQEYETITRGAVDDLNSNGFGVMGSVYPKSQSYTSNACGNYFYNIHAYPETALPYYWPTNDYRMAFYAYYPYNTSGLELPAANQSGRPVYNYTLLTSHLLHRMLMTAETTDILGGRQAPVEMRFKHQLSKITFNVTNNTSKTGTYNPAPYITGVPTSGSLSGDSWYNLTGYSTHITNTLPTTTTFQDKTFGPFYMIPCDLQEGAEFVIGRRPLPGNNDSQEYWHVDISNFSWEAGKSYTYNISINPNNIIIDEDSEIEDWTDNRFITPLTFVALENGTFSFSNAGLSYSLDNGATWTALAAGASTPTITAGNTIMWKNNTTLTPASSSGIGTFSSTGNFNAEGNIMSLYYGDNFSKQTDLSGKTFAFGSLFQNCTKIINAENLLLPATTLANYCYYLMFNGCEGLTTAPELPATTLANYCYYYMFYRCTSLTTAPELPATTLANYCYSDMFSGCTGLTTAPELPATTLASDCYSGMFNACTGLTTAPELPVTTLADYCYSNMFSGCTGLTTAPELPATTLAPYCYRAMFLDCTGLTTAPELPATTLANYCYSNMFYGCTRLTTAPALPATTLAPYCYSQMFALCSNLNYINATSILTPSEIYLKNWVYGVSSTGQIYITGDSNWTTGDSGIPSGWYVMHSGGSEI